VTSVCYLDDSNGACVAGRSSMEALARAGFSVEAFSGTALELPHPVDPAAWLAGRGLEFETVGGETWMVDAGGPRAEVPTQYRLTHRGVPVTLHQGPAGEVGERGREEFLRLLDEILERFRPDVVVNYGGDSLADEVRSRARARGAAVVFALHNFNYHDSAPFATADAVIVPSRFAADHYRKTLGLDCVVLPCLIAPDHVRPDRRDPRFLTFINPSVEKGVYPFARIADELGRRRPEIPLLVVEGRGTERTLADCGLDLRAHGNVHLMAHTHDPRRFWGVTKVCLVPSLWWENQPLVAVEAMVNGIPVIGSDRGGLPEALGNSGVVLPLPARLTTQTRELPTAEEVEPWVGAILRLWDDAGHFADRSRQALAEGQRWASKVLEPLHARFFAGVRPRARPAPSTRPGPSPAMPAGRESDLDPGRCVILVPVGHHIEPACEEGLRSLESRGYPVRRVRGFSAIDQGRNQIATDAIRDGFEELMWIDSDIAFEPEAVDRLRSLGLPIACGVYLKKKARSFACNFPAGTESVPFGEGGRMIEVSHAGAGFLHTRREVYQTIKERLGLPTCNERAGPAMIPFFQPMVVPEGSGHWYMAEDYAFCQRARDCGFRVIADTSIRLGHVGSYVYFWEDSSGEGPRHANFTFQVTD